jgi:uncharacterized membrane protein
MAGIRHRARRYGYRLKRRFQQEPFSTIVLYSVLLSIFFIVFAFRGMIFTMFVKPIGIVNPAIDKLTNPEAETPPEDTTKTGQTDEAVSLKSSGTYIVKEGDTLSSIAGALNLDWKKLAELNNIQPPYSLSNGQEIKLP